MSFICTQAHSHGFQGGDADRVADLEKRLKEAETERDILKKALGIISTSDR